MALPNRGSYIEQPYGWIDDPNALPFLATSYQERFQEKLAEDVESAAEEAIYFFSRMTRFKDATGREFYVNNFARRTPESPSLEDYLAQEDFDEANWEWIHEPLFLDFSRLFEKYPYDCFPIENTWFLQTPSFHYSILADEVNTSPAASNFYQDANLQYATLSEILLKKQTTNDFRVFNWRNR